MNIPFITPEKFKTLMKTRFLMGYDLEYETGRHYYIASRRQISDITPVKTTDEVKDMLPDAVTCYIILHIPGEEPRLLLQYEYRFPIGQFMLCPPAGIIDPEDKKGNSPLITAAVREIKEETGLDVKEGDSIRVINDIVFSTPGFTDECNGLVAADIYADDISSLNHSGAEGTELFGDFLLVTKEDAKVLIKSGKDPNGLPYPLYALSAMQYFLLRDI